MTRQATPDVLGVSWETADDVAVAMLGGGAPQATMHGSTVHWVWLSHVLPNPYQTRLSEDAEHIIGLARSIREERDSLPDTLGLQQVPLGRLVWRLSGGQVGALAQSQAGALTQAMTINSDLTRQAVALADKSEYVLALGAMALGAMLLALVVVVRHGGPSPATTREQPRAVILLETADGRVLRLVQEPGESLAAFEAQAEALTAPDAMRL